MMKTSFCSIAYRNKPDIGIIEIMRDVNAAGYDGLEIWWAHVENKSDAQLAEVKAAAAEQKLALPMLSPYLGNFNLPMTNYDEMIERTRVSAPVAEKLGIPLLRAFVGWTCECSSLTASEEYWQYNLKGFREMAKIAADFGRVIALETHTQTLIDSVPGIRRMIEEGDERLRVNFQLDEADDLAVNSKLVDGMTAYEAIKAWVVHLHLHWMPLEAKKANELSHILAALRLKHFSGFVSSEHCSGKGEPLLAVVEGRKMLTQLLAAEKK